MGHSAADPWTMPRGPQALELLPSGFHGDLHLHKLVAAVMQRAGVFIETGTNVGSTARHVAERWPETPVLTCEPHAEAHPKAAAHLSGLANVELRRDESPGFLERLLEERAGLASERPLFWLDAHSPGAPWPLLDEVRLIEARWGESFVMVDDCRVPGREEFGYDEYDGVACEPSYVLSAVTRRDGFVVLPAYTEHTSSHHPLRGVMLLVLGAELELAGELGALFERREIDELAERPAA